MNRQITNHKPIDELIHEPHTTNPEFGTIITSTDLNNFIYSLEGIKRTRNKKRIQQILLDP